MSDRRYYEVDVPTTITVFVEGDGLTAETAMEAAARYVDSIGPTENESRGYSSVAFADRDDGMAITRGDIEITGALSGLDTTADRLES